jgi:predicted permease
MLHDIRFALRLMGRDKGVALVTVAVLALGIGINAMVFTLVNAVLLKGLPFPESHNLYMLGWRRPDGPGSSVSWPELQEWRTQSRSFAGLAGFSNQSFNISDDRGLPEQARGARLTVNAFGVLRQQPLHGRDFTAQDEQRGAEAVVILGYDLWRNRYSSDPGVLGRTLRLNGEPATIVGVMPPDMQFPSSAQLWAPVRPTPNQEQQRTARFLAVFGRLGPGASRASADTELNGIAGRLSAEYPEAYKELRGAAIETFSERFNGGPIRVVFLSMLGAVGFVLLIACANVANLQLSQSARRAREICVRIAIGATRWRIVRQLLIESILLGLLGGVIGLALTAVGVRLFDAAVSNVGKPYWIIFTIDYVVFGYLAALCVLTGILFGLAPALHVSRTNINEVMKEGGRGTTGGRRARWFTGTMVVLEVAMTIILLVGAGLMIRSFLKLYSIDSGIRTENLMAMRLQLSADKYSKAETRRTFFEQLEPKLASIPGAEAAAVTTSVPPFGAPRRSFEIEGGPVRAAEEAPPEMTVVSVSPGFFGVVDASILRGRGFHETDGTPGAETAIINERMAAQFFQGQDPIGRRFRFVPRGPSPGGPSPQPAPEPWRTIVGISPTLRHNPPQDAEPAAVVYVPYRQELDRGVMLLVRSRLDSGVIMNAVRREVQAVDPDQPVFTVQTLDQMLAQSMWPYRVFGSLFALFAFIGLVLSAVGLYAVMAYSVTQRTPEIGVRMALGAEGRQVSWLFLKRGLLQLGIGVALGLAGAFGVSRVLRTLLVQITPTDPLTFVAISGLLVIVGVLACLVPARRATLVDPLVALRVE